MYYLRLEPGHHRLNKFCCQLMHSTVKNVLIYLKAAPTMSNLQSCAPAIRYTCNQVHLQSGAPAIRCTCNQVHLQSCSLVHFHYQCSMTIYSLRHLYQHTFAEFALKKSLTLPDSLFAMDGLQVSILSSSPDGSKWLSSCGSETGRFLFDIFAGGVFISNRSSLQKQSDWKVIHN